MSRIKSSGPISINDIRNEFGATGSPDLLEYRRGGVNATRVHSYGSGHNTNVGTSQVSLSQFYNAHRGWHLTCGVGGAGTTYEWRGYSNGQNIGAIGSINPTNYRGATIRGMYKTQFIYKGSTYWTMLIILSGYRARNWFNRYVEPGIGTYYTSSASWAPNSTSTTWSWTLSNFGSYTNGAVLSPETPQ